MKQRLINERNFLTQIVNNAFYIIPARIETKLRERSDAIGGVCSVLGNKEFVKHLADFVDCERLNLKKEDLLNGDLADGEAKEAALSIYDNSDNRHEVINALMKKGFVRQATLADYLDEKKLAFFKLTSDGAYLGISLIIRESDPRIFLDFEPALEAVSSAGRAHKCLPTHVKNAIRDYGQERFNRTLSVTVR